MLRNPVACVAHAVCALLLLCGCARNDETVVAVVDGTDLTGEQFRERFQKYLSSTGTRDNILARKQVLENMINERLIFEDLERSGAVNDSAYRRESEVIRRQALADGYSRRVTTDTLRVTQAQLEEEFRRFTTRISARFVYGRSAADALKLRRRLASGATFEQLAREAFNDPGLANNGGSLGSFGWGEMEAPLEEAAYSLPLGQLSAPIKLSMGFAIVRVDSRTVTNPLASEADFAKVKKKLADAIVERAIPRILREHVQEITRSFHPQFNDSTLKAIVASWNSFTGDGEGTMNPESSPPPGRDLRGKPVVNLRGSWWTVETLRERLADTKERQRRRVKDIDDLKDVILALVARDEIIARAKALRLEEDSKVAEQIRVLGDEFRLRFWARRVQDTVGMRGWPDTLLRRAYEANNSLYADPPMVNVAEVLVRTEPEAQLVAREARHGADFGRLARKRSIRLWAAKRWGELGYNSKAGFGVMGEKFFAARVGEIIGPARVDPYWGVFKVLERTGGRIQSFEEARERVQASVTETKKRESFVEAVAALRKRASIAENIENLANVAVQSENK